MGIALHVSLSTSLSHTASVNAATAAAATPTKAAVGTAAAAAVDARYNFSINSTSLDNEISFFFISFFGHHTRFRVENFSVARSAQFRILQIISVVNLRFLFFLPFRSFSFVSYFYLLLNFENSNLSVLSKYKQKQHWNFWLKNPNPREKRFKRFSVWGFLYSFSGFWSFFLLSM